MRRFWYQQMNGERAWSARSPQSHRTDFPDEVRWQQPTWPTHDEFGGKRTACNRIAPELFYGGRQKPSAGAAEWEPTAAAAKSPRLMPWAMLNHGWDFRLAHFTMLAAPWWLPEMAIQHSRWRFG